MIQASSPPLTAPARPPRAWPAWALGLLCAAALGGGIAAFGAWAIAGLVALFVAAAVLWRPYAGFLMVVASLPADVAGVIGGVESAAVLSVTKLLGALTAAAALLEAAVRQRPPELGRFWTPQTGLAVVFAALAAASAGLHASVEALRELVRLAIILAFLLVVIYFVDSPRRLRQTAGVLVLAGSAAALHSLIQRWTGAVTVSEEWIAQAGAVLDVGEEAIGQMLRTTGTFSHPAWLGLFVSLTVPLTLWAGWTAPRRRWKLLAAAALVVQVLGVLSTYSRMAYLGVALGVVLFTVRRRFGPGLLLGAGLLSVTTYPALPQELQERIESIVRYQESSSSLTRIGQQWAGWNMFRAHPLTGVGPGNFEAQVLRYGARVPERFAVQPIGAHNLYVEVAAELGLPGLAVILALLAVCVRDARRARRRFLSCGAARDALLWEAIEAAVWVFAFSALFVHAQDRKEWWLLAALIASGRRFAAAEAGRADGQVAG